MKLVTVIVPVYNVDEYLEECLESLIKQTYSNLEIILINDGSTDSSAKICDEYSSKYSNILVIHQKNQGVSIARNNGINMAKGDYLLFVDSDDIISELYVETMVETMNNNNCELVECSYTYNLMDLEHEYIENKIESYKSNIVFNKMLSKNKFNGYIWNKIFIKDIIQKNKIYFKENVLIWEDMLFVLEYLKSIKKVVIIDNKFYYYRNRIDSCCNEKISIEKLLSKLKVCNIFFDFKCSSEEFKENLNNIYLNLLIDLVFWDIKYNKLSLEERKNATIKIKKLKKISDIKFKQHIKLVVCWFYRISKNIFRLFNFIIKIKL